jgi:hypothetical protein
MVVRVKSMLEAMFGEKAVEMALDLMDKNWNTFEDFPTATTAISSFKNVDREEARRVYAVMVFLEDHEEVM